MLQGQLLVYKQMSDMTPLFFLVFPCGRCHVVCANHTYHTSDHVVECKQKSALCSACVKSVPSLRGAVYLQWRHHRVTAVLYPPQRFSRVSAKGNNDDNSIAPGDHRPARQSSASHKPTGLSERRERPLATLIWLAQLMQSQQQTAWYRRGFLCTDRCTRPSNQQCRRILDAAPLSPSCVSGATSNNATYGLAK